MALFRLTVKRKFGVRQGKFAEPGMTAEVTYNGSNFPIGDTKYRLEVAAQLKAKYGIDLDAGQVSTTNFDVSKS